MDTDGWLPNCAAHKLGVDTLLSLVVNRKRVRRFMQQMGLAADPPKRRVRTTNSAHSFPRYPNLVFNLEVERPDQVWVGDITYVRLRNEFVYLAVVMDVFTRSVRGWHLGRSLDGELTVTALRRALLQGAPEIHHSDQGVQYAAGGYVEWSCWVRWERPSAWHRWVKPGRTGTPRG